MKFIRLNVTGGTRDFPIVLNTAHIVAVFNHGTNTIVETTSIATGHTGPGQVRYTVSQTPEEIFESLGPDRIDLAPADIDLTQAE
ncbi:hypothetical protein [Roseibium sp.]|uniref:hypothetical protein n=1 Tax=Roseibium sp. TaxID=1936156 RepID=UPI003B515AD8